MKLLFLQAVRHAMVKDGNLSVTDIADGVVMNPPEPDCPIVVPPIHLATIVECSIGEGTRHDPEFRLVNADGEVISEPMRPGAWEFSPNRQGRLLRFYSAIKFQPIVPRFGEYLVKLFVDERDLGETLLYVDPPANQALVDPCQPSVVSSRDAYSTSGPRRPLTRRLSRRRRWHLHPATAPGVV